MKGLTKCFMVLIFCLFWGYWGLSSEFRAYSASTLPLEPHPKSSWFLFLMVDVVIYLRKK
jgi:hypothetical protein